MRNRIVMALVSAGLLVLSGCTRSYELNGERMLALDEAIAEATTTEDLWALWAQAESDDKIILEEEILDASSRSQDTDSLQKLSTCTASYKIRSEANRVMDERKRVAQEAWAKREREEQQVQAQKRADEIRLAMKESRQRLMREAGGRLDDKSAEEVKRLVDNWRTPQGSLQVSPYNFDLWQLYMKDYEESFHTNDFYKAFGQPQRKQLINRAVAGIFGLVDHDFYYFYYQCKDGTVQIEIDADSLSKEDLVLVSGLNIL